MLFFPVFAKLQPRSAIPTRSESTSIPRFRADAHYGWKSHLSSNLFRINTCKSVSKQMTLTSFGMNTYKNMGGGGVPLSLTGIAATRIAIPKRGSSGRCRPKDAEVFRDLREVFPTGLGQVVAGAEGGFASGPPARGDCETLVQRGIDLCKERREGAQ
jgi:hypothetical protein